MVASLLPFPIGQYSPVPKGVSFEKELYAGGGVAIDVEQRPRQAREALRAPFVSRELCMDHWFRLLERGIAKEGRGACQSRGLLSALHLCAHPSLAGFHNILTPRQNRQSILILEEHQNVVRAAPCCEMALRG